MNWCEKHDHFKRTCPWCEIEEMEAQLDQALKALEELHEVSVLLASRIELSITAKRLREERDFWKGQYDRQVERSVFLGEIVERLKQERDKL